MMNPMSKSDFSPTGDHEPYVELCALATSGTLSDQEWCRLKAHLDHCADCRKLVQEYREIARTGMALLMPEQTADDQANAQQFWSPDLAKRDLFGRIARGETAAQYHLRRPAASHTKASQLWQWLLRPMPQLVLRY